MYFMCFKLIYMIVVLCIHEHICGSIMSSGQLGYCLFFCFFKCMYPDQKDLVLFKYM